MVLDKNPYPLDKWLFISSHFSPTAKFISEDIENILNEIKKNNSSMIGSSSNNKISDALKRIRIKLIEKANQLGINELWLEKWYRYVDPAEDIIKSIKWN